MPQEASSKPASIYLGFESDEQDGMFVCLYTRDALICLFLSNTHSTVQYCPKATQNEIRISQAFICKNTLQGCGVLVFIFVSRCKHACILLAIK